MNCFSVFLSYLAFYCSIASDSFLLSSVAAGHATESFSDFVVGHGELWSAQMLSYVVRKVQWLFAHCHEEYLPIVTLTIYLIYC
jgi:aspartokinase